MTTSTYIVVLPSESYYPPKVQKFLAGINDREDD